MKRQQLTHWQHGEHVVLVELDGSNLTISRKQDDVEEALALPVTRALLLALREACDQALRGLPSQGQLLLGKQVVTRG